MLSKRKKQNTIKEHQVHKEDTGSPQVQIAIASRRITELADHLKKHPKDKHSRRGLLGLVNKRRKLLKYLADKSPINYKKLVTKLGLKK
ncbi:MAG: 30S ribosomal protein S15 [Candidatus Colwellbacteria bacterium CG10_big_fil_rev_8_21_14_0_10_41_28]|uniref:Small ribosomal subunit protein uS15 n=1 Tax=Candidatus Colwellbacteria bacterium CG10_big_fil_rev_8_21_14_0_10_41_28 TaxID=1974539 RepID=A0A2H0VH23_9BACT|nr:MAG: 30S ribosomal protein S15 [Candidatus Colwellbacteria bacterium CG10_big_fil_rev_8_21_14_0_10_41_28]